MATQSIRKNVKIKSTNDVKRFVSALEEAENKQGKDVVLSKPYHKRSRKWMQKHFQSFC